MGDTVEGTVIVVPVCPLLHVIVPPVQAEAVKIELQPVEAGAAEIIGAGVVHPPPIVAPAYW